MIENQRHRFRIPDDITYPALFMAVGDFERDEVYRPD